MRVFFQGISWFWPKKYSNIFKYGLFWYHFVDILSLIQNLYKYSIVALVKKSKIQFKQTLPCKNSKN